MKDGLDFQLPVASRWIYNFQSYATFAKTARHNDDHSLVSVSPSNVLAGLLRISFGDCQPEAYAPTLQDPQT